MGAISWFPSLGNIALALSQGKQASFRKDIWVQTYSLAFVAYNARSVESPSLGVLLFSSIERFNNKDIFHSKMEEPILVTGVGIEMLEDKIASYKGLILIKQQEKIESSKNQFPDDESLNIVPALEREIENLVSRLSNYQSTRERLKEYNEIDESQLLTEIQLGTYVVLRFSDGEIQKLYVSGLSDGKRMIGGYNYLGEPISLGRALLRGNVKEGDKVLGTTVLEISHGDSTFRLEKDLSDAFKEYSDSLDIAKREGNEDTLRKTKSKIDSKIDWMYEEMSRLNHQYYDAVESLGLEKVPSLDQYADSKRGRRIDIRTSLPPNLRHFFRSYVTLKRFLEDFQRL